MQFTLAALLALWPLLVSTAPPLPRSGTVIPLTRRAPDVQALPAQLARTLAKINAGFDNYKKNTGVAHPSDTRDLAKRASGVGSEPLTDFEEGLWFGPITVGTPPQSFTADFDTGSTDLILPSTACTANCQGHNLYNPNASSTAVNLHEGIGVAFGDGSSQVVADLFNDTLSIAGFTATKQPVAAAVQYSTQLNVTNFPTDSIAGLAFPQLSAVGSLSIFQTLVAERKTAQPVFGVNLADSGSELFLGGVDGNKFKGGFTTVKVNPVGFWQVALDGVKLGSRTVVPRTTSIIDTGTSLIIGEPADVHAFYGAIPGARNASATVGPGFFTFPCRTKVNLSLVFGGRAFAVPDSLFNLGQVSATECVGAITTIDNPPDFWVIGDVFLRTVYTKFDVANKEVGFATLQ